MDVLQRNNVVVGGRPGAQPMLFAHGFGCDQSMWRFVTPAFADTHRTVVFDHVGFGGSDLSAHDPEVYASLTGYARDVTDICDSLDLADVVFVGHSVGAMIGVLAAIDRPDLFASLVLVGPSPRYIDDDGYVGGFSHADIDELLESLDSNYLGWSSTMAPVIMGNDDRPELGQELTASFCRTDPGIAKHFARVTCRGDNRDDLARVPVPCLVVQSGSDAIAPQAVGEYVHAQLPDSDYVTLDSTGHCPNLSAPDQLITAMRTFLDRRSAAAQVRR